LTQKTFFPMLCSLLNTSCRWINVTTDVKNRTKTIQDLATNNKFDLDSESELNPFNPALLMASAYIFFVYPKEHSVLVEFDTSEFTIIHGENKELERRLRNSIAHGNYKFLEKNVIEFTDSYPDGGNLVIFSIPMVTFGDVLNKCLKKTLKTLRHPK